MNGKETRRLVLPALEDAPVGPHLSAEELQRLATTNDAGPGRAHLVQCAVCLAEFKDVRAFFAAPEAEETIADVALAWQIFKPNVEVAAAPVTVVTPRRSWRELLAPRLGWALACGLLLLAAGNLWWALRLRGEKKELARNFEREKQVYVKQLGDTQAEKTRLEKQTIILQKQKEELEQQKSEPPPPDEGPPPRGPNAAGPVYEIAESGVELPPPARDFVLVLKGSSLPAAPLYRAVLVNQAGQTIWRANRLRRDRAGKFTLTLAQSLLARGAYRLSIIAPDGKTVIYPVRVK